MAESAKRRRGSDGGSHASRGSSAKRPRPPAGAMQEEQGGTPGDLATEVVAQQRKLAKFEVYDTELLRAWLFGLADWKTLLPEAKTAGREAILSTLVMSSQPPKGKSQEVRLRVMQQAWTARGGKGVPPDAMPPASAAASASAAPSASRKERGHSPRGTGWNSADEEELPVSDAGQESEEEEEEDDEVGDGQREESVPVDALLVTSGQPAHAQHHWALGCDTCCVVPPTAPLGGRWVCVCGLRGDLPTGHPTNLHLASIKAASTKGMTAPAAAAGQTTESTAVSHLAKLESHLSTLAKDGYPEHPLFATPSLGAAVFTPEEAIRVARQALGATQLAAPTPALIKLIQTGKLVRPAFALPIPFSRLSGASMAVASISFGGLGGPTITTSHNPCDPPPLASLEEFDAALFGTIIPALISRPAALMQWVALARTVHSIAANPSRGWGQARDYLDSLLAERSGFSDKTAFAAPSDAILRDLETAAGHGRFFPPGQAAPAARARGHCDAYQTVNGCHRSPKCDFLHLCAVCNGAHPASANGPCAAVYRPAARNAGGKDRTTIPRSGSQRQRSAPGGSVRTAATPAASPKAGSPA